MTTARPRLRARIPGPLHRAWTVTKPSSVHKVTARTPIGRDIFKTHGVTLNLSQPNVEAEATRSSSRPCV